jgi:hypothetical protein
MSDIDDVKFDIEDEFEWIESDKIEENLNDAEEELFTDDDDSKSTQRESSDNESNRGDIYKFLSLVKQIEYSFYSEQFPAENINNIPNYIEGNISTANKIADKIGFDLKNLSHIYYYNQLVRQVSYLESFSFNGSQRLSEIINESDSAYLDKIMAINIEGTVTFDEYLVSDDVALHIKSTLVPYTMFFNFAFERVLPPEALNNFLRTVIEISRDLSTNWSKRSNISDKHILFTGTIELIARFCMHEMIVFVKKELNKKEKIKEGIHENLWEAIDDYDLGLNDFPDDKKFIIDKTNKIIDARISDFVVDFKFSSVFLNRELLKISILEDASSVWRNYAKKEVDRYKSLSSADKKDYIKVYRNKPKLSSFFDDFILFLDNYLEELYKVDVDKEMDLHLREKFSLVWGVSDAYCKYKKKT